MIRAICRPSAAVLSRLLLALVLLLAATAPAAAAPADPSDGNAGPGSITGIVTDTEGEPAADANVTAFNIYTYLEYTARTAADGTYRIAGLPRGDYNVSVMTVGEHAIYGGILPVTVRVASGVETGGIDMQFAEAVNLSGMVYEADGTTPIANASITAIAGQWQYMASSDALGAFSLLVPPGYGYRVRAESSGYRSEYFADSYEYFSSTLVEAPVPAGQSIVFTLDQPGSIAGVISADGSGDPIAGATVLLQPQGDNFPYWLTFTTGADGAYLFEDLNPGNYYVRASADGMSPQYYPAAFSVETATPVALASGVDRDDVDLALSPAPTLSGHVYGPDGVTPLEGVWVDLYEHDKDMATAYATTGSDGAYTFGDAPNYNGEYLTPGSYIIRAQEYGSTYAGEYYPDAATRSEAEEVALGPGANVTGKDFSLDVGGTISGEVLASDGAPLSNVRVELQDADGNMLTYQTLQDGNYDFFLPLKPGNYYVFAEAAGYLPGYHADAAVIDDADPVVVEAGETADADITLHPAAEIHGYISRYDGFTPIYYAKILVEGAADHKIYGEYYEYEGGGFYSIENLPAGSYTVRAESYGSERVEYYQDAFTPETATPIVLTDGEERMDVDIALDCFQSGHITAGGGSAELDCGGPGGALARLIFPAGAAAAHTVINVQRMSTTPVLPEGYLPTSLHYQVTAEDEEGEAVTLDEPFDLTLDYLLGDLGGASEWNLVLLWHNPSSDTWERMPTWPNAGAHRVSASVDRLGEFMVASSEVGNTYLPAVMSSGVAP